MASFPRRRSATALTASCAAYAAPSAFTTSHATSSASRRTPPVARYASSLRHAADQVQLRRIAVDGLCLARPHQLLVGNETEVSGAPDRVPAGIDKREFFTQTFFERDPTLRVAESNEEWKERPGATNPTTGVFEGRNGKCLHGSSNHRRERLVLGNVQLHLVALVPRLPKVGSRDCSRRGRVTVAHKSSGDSVPHAWFLPFSWSRDVRCRP